MTLDHYGQMTPFLWACGETEQYGGEVQGRRDAHLSEVTGEITGRDQV